MSGTTVAGASATLATGPMSIQLDAAVWLLWVCAQMEADGCGVAAFNGSVMAGFVRAEPSVSFAVGLAKRSLLPRRVLILMAVMG